VPTHSVIVHNFAHIKGFWYCYYISLLKLLLVCALVMSRFNR